MTKKDTNKRLKQNLLLSTVTPFMVDSKIVASTENSQIKVFDGVSEKAHSVKPTASKS